MFGLGGPKSTGEGVTYKVTDIHKGDVVIVRTGINKVCAIGVVLHNGYKDGWEKEEIIRVAFLHVNEGEGRNTSAQFPQHALCHIGEKNFEAVRQEYANTFRLLDKIRERQGNTAEPCSQRE